MHGLDGWGIKSNYKSDSCLVPWLSVRTEGGDSTKVRVRGEKIAGARLWL